MTTGGFPVAPSHDHENAGSTLRFHRHLQCVRRTTFALGAGPGVRRNIRRKIWITLARRSTYRIRCEEKFHALDVTRGSAVTLIHVAASNPFGSRRHSDLIAESIITNRRSHGV